jgi:hypothetical protein
MSEEIRSFIRENREIAAVQAERWQGVDPSRLLQALDYLEGLLGSRTPTDDDVIQLVEAAAKAVSALSDVASLREQITRDPWSPVTITRFLEAYGVYGSALTIADENLYQEQLIAHIEQEARRLRLSITRDHDALHCYTTFTFAPNFDAPAQMDELTRISLSYGGISAIRSGFPR